jgi:hypothetical protein
MLVCTKWTTSARIGAISTCARAIEPLEFHSVTGPRCDGTLRVAYRWHDDGRGAILDSDERTGGGHGDRTQGG